ncbi:MULTISPECIES: ParB/RepB/Spo0J family partition protein [Nostoc]|uniref:ParB/RepB/Spo0J family partition protein n=1 Tax=Nostoc paludosum FACHB-159 TaxID=2692908 RepID=A0ABR8KJ80_9NOSO|nr:MULTISPECIES: ParB/RepB/Spo0J family partition protein [Nostoc]MBD2683318.1 ParB/RepB/Spo0J family partition protein [Nostoc sp. FACHB-857]MBD2739622.1 ParB/RepB/Spo0J family partition protein [Nostoc paludosum FACHB-159]
MRRTTKASQPLKSKIEVPWDTTAINNAASSQSMPLDQIVLPATQPRRYFDPESLKQLTESIKQHGILQPLLVRPVADGKHELVAGERRYRAATELALKEVPVVIKELDDNAAFQLALVENLLREDLNPVEETEGILQLLALKLCRSLEEVPPLLYRLQRLQNKASTVTHNVMGAVESDSDNNAISDDEGEGDKPTHNVMGGVETESTNNVVSDDKGDIELSTHNVMGETETDDSALNHEPAVNQDLKIVKEVFDGLGLMTWESFVKNRLPLLNLPEDILDALREGSLEYTKARAIAQIQKLDERVEFLEQAIANNWSLSEIRQRISEKKAAASTSNTESNDYKERFTAATTKLRKSRIWSDPKKRKQIEKLLAQLETLTNVE